MKNPNFIKTEHLISARKLLNLYALYIFMRRDTREYSTMILAKPTEEIKFSEIEQLLLKEDPYARSTAAQAIGKKGGRQAYTYLIQLMKDADEGVKETAIIATAQTKDSRFIFPLANLYNQGDYKTKKAVITALKHLKDPRAIDFLEELQEENATLRTRIKECIQEQDSTKRFEYTFIGTEKEREKAKQKKKFRLPLHKPEDLHPLAIYLENVIRKSIESYGPLTYIVNENGKLYIGGLTEEHVEVARGDNVLAAGEINVNIDRGKWKITKINNSSNGYFPARTSFRIIHSLLDHLGFKHPGKFTYLHPREGFFSDDFLRMFPFHPEYEKNNLRKRKTNQP